MNKEKLEKRREEKAKEKEIAKIESQKNQKPVKRITITIEWKRSRTWGNNPHAQAEVLFSDGTHTSQDNFTASGCGYDKESTVIGVIFNTFLRYKLYGKIRKTAKTYENGKAIPCHPYGISISKTYRSYGQGVGTNCYYNIGKAIGGVFKQLASGKKFDVYVWEAKK